jgi:hypothetical protein
LVQDGGEIFANAGVVVSAGATANAIATAATTPIKAIVAFVGIFVVIRRLSN